MSGGPERAQSDYTLKEPALALKMHHRDHSEHREDTEEIWQSGPDDTQSLRNLIFLILSVALRGPPW